MTYAALCATGATSPMTAILCAEALVLRNRSPEASMTFATRGQNVVTVGAPADLFSALGRRDLIASGTLLLGGEPPLEALSSGRVAIASWQIPLPLASTCREYLEWNRALFGGGPSIFALESRLGIAHCSGKRLRDLAVHERRSACLAAAMATGASTLLFEDPCEGFGDQQAVAYAQQWIAALSGSKWVCLMPTLVPTNPFARAADEVLRFVGTKLWMQGSAQNLFQSQRSFVVRVTGDTSAFAEALRPHAARVIFPTASPDLVTVELAESDTTVRLFQAATQCGVRISEVLPYDHEVK